MAGYYFGEFEESGGGFGGRLNLGFWSLLKN
jgi:hypothetical protein